MKLQIIHKIGSINLGISFVLVIMAECDKVEEVFQLGEGCALFKLSSVRSYQRASA